MKNPLDHINLHFNAFIIISTVLLGLVTRADITIAANTITNATSNAMPMHVVPGLIQHDPPRNYANHHSTSRRQSATGSILVKATCGYPGSPRNGRVLHLLERYQEGMVVTYECNPGYYLLGPMTRTCQSNGTWSNRMPICDQSMKNLGLTSASEALNNYPPQLAVDGNFRTCFFSNRRKPRWWRVELPKSKNHSIISVALTLPPINAELFFSIYVIEIETLNEQQEEQSNSANNNGNDTANIIGQTSSTSSKYHKCATFRGVFSSKTIFVQCSNTNNVNDNSNNETIDGGGGLRGNFLQIEDDYPQLEYFGLCEVDLFIERDHYECGDVEVPAFGMVRDRQITIDGVRSVEYHCNDGHRLIGDPIRYCNTRNGQWIGPEPYCQRITCLEPEPIPNSFHRVYGDYYDQPVVGTKTVYECRPGFVLVDITNDTRVCDSYGQWSGDIPRCEPIDCGHPESLLVNSEEFFLSGAQFRLLNGTTHFSSIAELLCSTQDIIRGNLTRTSLWFRCREDGIWTEFQMIPVTNDNFTSSNNGLPPLSLPSGSSGNSCVKQRHNGFLYFYAYGSKNFFRKNFYIRETSVNILHLLAAVVIAAFLSIFIIVILLFKRNIIEWPTTVEYCSNTGEWIKSTGQSIVKFFVWIFVTIKSYVGSLDFKKCCCCCWNRFRMTKDQCSTKHEDQENGKQPYTITPQPTMVKQLDLESGPSNSNVDQPQQSLLTTATRPPACCSTSSNVETGSDQHHTEHNSDGGVQVQKKSDDLNTALATFYEEITNAAKQMFSEETDRKLLRAARIAAELDAIKHQPEPLLAKNNYQWIYATPPRFSHTGSNMNAGSTSLPPSLHEYYQIQPTNNQIYAKVDLIRKHRYRKDKDGCSNQNVYQVPRPHAQQSGYYYHHSTIARTSREEIGGPGTSGTGCSSTMNYHQLRKAISTPDAVFIANSQNNCDPGYGTIKRLLMQQPSPTNHNGLSSGSAETTNNPMVQIITAPTSSSNGHVNSTNIITASNANPSHVIHEPINKYPLKTLL